jgi:hypothetical protein
MPQLHFWVDFVFWVDVQSDVDNRSGQCASDPPTHKARQKDHMHRAISFFGLASSSSEAMCFLCSFQVTNIIRTDIGSHHNTYIIIISLFNDPPTISFSRNNCCCYPQMVVNHTAQQALGNFFIKKKKKTPPAPSSTMLLVHMPPIAHFMHHTIIQ